MFESTLTSIPRNLRASLSAFSEFSDKISGKNVTHVHLLEFGTEKFWKRIVVSHFLNGHYSCYTGAMPRPFMLKSAPPLFCPCLLATCFLALTSAESHRTLGVDSHHGMSRHSSFACNYHSALEAFGAHLLLAGEDERFIGWAGDTYRPQDLPSQVPGTGVLDGN